MKKILSLTLCILLCALAVFPSLSASAAEENNLYRNNNYIFEVVNNCEVSIHYYIGTADTVTVPAEICGLPVRSIEKWAFFGTDVKEVTVSEGISTIGEETFYNCQSLETVVLPSTLESTDKAIFRFCQNLKNVTFSGTNSDPALGKYLLYACNSLESVNIPSKVTEIPEGMFAYCQSLDNVVLPEGTKKINDNAFYGSGISSITLPEPLYYIGDMAFADCATLDEINNLRESCDIVSENAFEGSPAVNPYEETEKITIYFANTMDWKDISISFFATNYSETYGWCEIDMTFMETNHFGQDVYKADIPTSTNIYFNGFYEKGKISTSMSDAIIDNNAYFISNGLEIDSYNYSPHINPLKPEIITVYFANTKGWTDINVYHYLSKPTENGEYLGRGIAMNFLETNAFGQDIYKADIPVTTTVTFSGYNENELIFPGSAAEIIEDNNAFYAKGERPIVFGVYKYSPDINPLDPDAIVPVSTEDEITTRAKTSVQPVGASSPDEFSGQITEDGYLVGAPYPEVVKREKSRLTTIGAQVEEDLAATSQKALNAREWGDTNLDGDVNIIDATLIQKYAAELVNLNYDEHKNADVDCNGNLNVKDATAIQKFLVQLNPNFPKGPFQSA